jgi:hypothetical protein
MPTCLVCRDVDPAELEFGEQISMSALRQQRQACRGCDLLYQALACFKTADDPDEDFFLEEQTWPGMEQTLTYRIGSDGMSDSKISGDLEFYTLSGKVKLRIGHN